ncbi:MAG: hypothetical protein N2646_09505 [Bellilinea sp.]|nr:hypothetical protein [Bellilinea sp.]
MDHIVYANAKSQEIEEILTGMKTMFVPSASRRKTPFTRVEFGDRFCFTPSNSIVAPSTTWTIGCRLETLKW